LVLLLWRDCRETVWPVGLANGDELPPLKRKVIVLVALDLALVVQLYGVGPGSWVWERCDPETVDRVLRLSAEDQAAGNLVLPASMIIPRSQARVTA
jgi:hypothetical protein